MTTFKAVVRGYIEFDYISKGVELEELLVLNLDSHSLSFHSLLDIIDEKFLSSVSYSKEGVSEVRVCEHEITQLNDMNEKIGKRLRDEISTRF